MYSRIRSGRFVSTWNVRSGRSPNTANIRSSIQSGTHSPNASVMSPTNTRLPVTRVRRMRCASASSKYGVSVAWRFAVNAPSRSPVSPRADHADA